MHGLVRAGRDSDEDLLLLFGPGKNGGLPKMVRECRSEVRQAVVMPMLSGPGNLATIFQFYKGPIHLVYIYAVGTPANTMQSFFMQDFAHKPFKPRMTDAKEVSEAKDFMDKVKEARAMLKEIQGGTEEMQIACKKCGNAATKVKIFSFLIYNRIFWEIAFYVTVASTMWRLHDGVVLHERVSGKRLAHS
jgi:hypothetical protein